MFRSFVPASQSVTYGHPDGTRDDHALRFGEASPRFRFDPIADLRDRRDNLLIRDKFRIEQNVCFACLGQYVDSAHTRLFSEPRFYASGATRIVHARNTVQVQSQAATAGDVREKRSSVEAQAGP